MKNLKIAIGADPLGLDLKEHIKEYLVKSTSKGLAARVGIIAGVKSISDQRKIEKYLDEHPNSKLSRKEILKAIHAGE